MIEIVKRQRPETDEEPERNVEPLSPKLVDDLCDFHRQRVQSPFCDDPDSPRSTQRYTTSLFFSQRSIVHPISELQRHSVLCVEGMKRIASLRIVITCVPVRIVPTTP